MFEQSSQNSDGDKNEFTDFLTAPSQRDVTRQSNAFRKFVIDLNKSIEVHSKYWPILKPVIVPEVQEPQTASKSKVEQIDGDISAGQKKMERLRLNSANRTTKASESKEKGSNSLKASETENYAKSISASNQRETRSSAKKAKAATEFAKKLDDMNEGNGKDETEKPVASEGSKAGP